MLHSPDLWARQAKTVWIAPYAQREEGYRSVVPDNFSKQSSRKKRCFGVFFSCFAWGALLGEESIKGGLIKSVFCLLGQVNYWEEPQCESKRVFFLLCSPAGSKRPTYKVLKYSELPKGEPAFKRLNSLQTHSALYMFPSSLQKLPSRLNTFPKESGVVPLSVSFQSLDSTHSDLKSLSCLLCKGEINICNLAIYGEVVYDLTALTNLENLF